MREPPTIHAVQQAVCARFRVRLSDMQSRRRGRAAARPRQVAMWVARHVTMATLLEIGLEFGGRDHTTVMQAIKVVDRLMANCPEFASVVWTAVHDVDSVEDVAFRRSLMRLVA